MLSLGNSLLNEQLGSMKETKYWKSCIKNIPGRFIGFPLFDFGKPVSTIIGIWLDRVAENTFMIYMIPEPEVFDLTEKDPFPLHEINPESPDYEFFVKGPFTIAEMRSMDYLDSGQLVSSHFIIGKINELYQHEG